MAETKIEASDIDDLIKRIKHSFHLMQVWKSKNPYLIHVFEKEFAYTDSIPEPHEQELQDLETFEKFQSIAAELKSIARIITEHFRIVSIEKKLIQMISIEDNVDVFIKRSDTNGIDYHFLVTNLDKQVGWLTNEMVQLKNSMWQKDSTITKLVDEILAQNEIIRAKSVTETELRDEISKLKLQVKEKRWGPSYLNSKEKPNGN